MPVTTDRGGSCSICQEAFSPEDQQFTHVGGEGHDGFHKECLATWLKTKATCPYRCGDINPYPLLSRCDQIKSTLVDAAVIAVAIIGIASVIFQYPHLPL